jgi:enamine deaminase RidA (YjgF/YER057c/UK114 family)
MKQVVDCWLPNPAQPFSRAVKTNGIVFTSYGPVGTHGIIIEVGSIQAQARLTFESLRRTMIEMVAYGAV